MTIQLWPEDEQLVQKWLETGNFDSAEDMIHQALLQRERELASLELETEMNQGKIEKRS